MVYGNPSNYICLHGVFSLTTQYSFLCSMSFFIACVLKPLNLAETIRLKAVDLWKVKMNKRKLLQSSLKQYICFQTRTNKWLLKRPVSICFVFLHCASLAFPILIYFKYYVFVSFSPAIAFFICLLYLSPVPFSTFSPEAASILKYFGEKIIIRLGS